MRKAVRQGEANLETTFLLITYTLATGMKISPLEIMKMPAEMVMDFLYLHRNIEEFKSDTLKQEMDKAKKK